MLLVSELLLLVLVPAALIAAAGWDLASFTIPNAIPAGLLLGFAVVAISAGLSWSMIEGHVLAGMAALLMGFALFAFGIVGGGDAKLFCGAAVWLGLTHLPEFIFVASLLGGALTLAILMFRSLPLPALLARHAWLLRLHDRESGIPYGVALSAGACALLPYSDVFQTALRS